MLPQQRLLSFPAVFAFLLILYVDQHIYFCDFALGCLYSLHFMLLRFLAWYLWVFSAGDKRLEAGVHFCAPLDFHVFLHYFIRRSFLLVDLEQLLSCKFQITLLLTAKRPRRTLYLSLSHRKDSFEGTRWQLSVLLWLVALLYYFWDFKYGLFDLLLFYDGKGWWFWLDIQVPRKLLLIVFRFHRREPFLVRSDASWDGRDSICATTVW